MDLYHIWCDLKPGVSDTEFASSVSNFLGFLQEQGKISAWRVTRRKLGFGLRELGEFHIIIETENLAQLDAAFQLAATRSGDVEERHFAVYSLVQNFRAALYRDFPDAVRVRGGRKAARRPARLGGRSARS